LYPERAPPIQHLVLLLFTGLIAGGGAGLLWSAIYDDAGTARARAWVICAFWLPLALGALAGGWTPILILQVALRTGWARQVAEARRPFATLTSALGFLAVFLWPNLPLPAGDTVGAFTLPGIALFQILRTFLLVQMGVQAIRFLLGLVFGPRRIGRRLLVSHMLAGVIPVALLTLFAALISLLMMANHRATTGEKMLRMQHEFSQELLGQRVSDELVAMRLDPTGGDRFIRQEQLPELAVRIAARWPELASWHDGDEEVRREPSRVSGLARGVLITLGMQTTAAEEPYAITLGRSLTLDVLPSPGEWFERTPATDGAGLIRIQGVTFHASDYALTAEDQQLRIQVLEELPVGRVRVLEECLHGRARIEEAFAFTGDNRFTATGAFGTATPEADSPSPINTSHVLLPALEWSPPPAQGTVDITSAPQEAWQRIRLPVLGIAGLTDLVPRLASFENPVGWVPILILLFTALLFVGVESFAFISALRMGRSIATSVSRLRAGAERLQRGELTYRIRMTGEDELANLGDAFNEMAAGLEVGQRVALEKERLEGELALARRIQQRLLPTEPPNVAGLQCAGQSLPARHVGGDYYDFIQLDEDHLMFVMADVSGKGTPAALLMSSLRASLHSMLPACDDCGKLVHQLNRYVHASTSLTEFVTMFLGVVDGPSGKLHYVNAGHEQPYLIRENGEQVRLTEGGLVLGAFPEATYETASLQLHPGDLLFLYTDGLPDATNESEEVFGIERVARSLQGNRTESPEKILADILGESREFVQDADAIDDITLLAMRRVSPV